MYDISPRDNPNVAADRVRVPRVDDFILLLQRELVEDVALGANLTARYTRNVFVYDEQNVIYDQDGSSIIGARNGDTLVGQARLRTPDQAKRDYYQADVYLDKRDSRRWAGRVTYTYQESFGNAPESLTGSFANDPQLQYAYGRTLTNINHQVKGYAYWSLPTDPWVQTLGVFVTYLSGPPLERLYYSNFGYNLRIRPRGEYTRFPPEWFVSVKFSQDLDVRKGKLVLDFEARNLFNNRAADGLSGLFYSQNRLLITSRQDPLTMQFGLRYLF
jgi:hypothetical protein